MGKRAMAAACAGLLLLLSPLSASQARQSRIQRAIDEAMARLQGSVVVIDVVSGRLVASHRLDAAARRLAAPGSTIKPFTLLALMQAGIVRPQTTLVCRKDARIGGRNLACSHVDIREPIDAMAALAYSCNSFFLQMAERLPVGGLTDALRQTAIASTTGLVPNEVAGSVRTPGTREAHQLMAIGESGIEVTPAGLASAYRKLALRARNNDAEVKPVVEAMTAAVRFGTGQLAAVDGLRIAGKTGTSPAPDQLRTYAWFAGFAPADRPEIAIAVFLEQGSGGGDAAPVAQKVFAAFK